MRRTALVALLPLLLTAGCTVTGGAGDADTRDTSRAATEALQAQIESLPGVSGAYANYEDGIDLQARMLVGVEVDDAAAAQATYDDVERAVWLSEVDPLLSLTISVGPAAGAGAGITRDYDLDDAAVVDELTDRWGDRP